MTKREGSVPAAGGRRSGDMILGITEEEEEEEEEEVEGMEEEDGEMEDLLLDEGEGEGEEGEGQRFASPLGGALLPGSNMEREHEEAKHTLSPTLSPSSGEEAALGAPVDYARKEVRLSVPLTAEALAKMEAEEEGLRR